MQKREITFSSELIGRKVSNLVYGLNNKYNSYGVYIEKDGRTVNAHSILGVLSLYIKSGDTITIYSDCDNFEFDEIIEFIKSNI